MAYRGECPRDALGAEQVAGEVDTHYEPHRTGAESLRLSSHRQEDALEAISHLQEEERQEQRPDPKQR